jgi:indolepyruvate ferredoxin oxidoreductase
MAAHIEERGVSVLNQTGLAQKFGAVTGHVRIAAKQRQIHSVRIPSGEASLVLGADLVVSAANDALAKLNHEHSHVVINNHLSPTADFTHDTDAIFPVIDMQQTIEEQIEPGRGHFVNATRLATSLLGDTIFSNFLLLGVAYQLGLVPLDAESILEAIELNGVAVEKNGQAFMWGRRYAVDADAVRRAAGFEQPHQPESDQSDLDEIIAYRSNYLVDYQDQAYADRYLRLVEQTRKLEQPLYPQNGPDKLALTEAVARSYFSLLAYKDEYEVARLYSNGDFETTVAKQFEGDYKLRFQLAPPLLARRDPQTGIPLKREFGRWVMPLFRVLAGLKQLRGGAFDIFGYSDERKLERKLIADYEQDIEQLLGEIKPHTIGTAVEIARLPQKIRGFGHVKQASIESVAATRASLFKKFNGDDGVDTYKP